MKRIADGQWHRWYTLGRAKRTTTVEVTLRQQGRIRVMRRGSGEPVVEADIPGTVRMPIEAGEVYAVFVPYPNEIPKVTTKVRDMEGNLLWEEWDYMPPDFVEPDYPKLYAETRERRCGRRSR